MMKEQNEKGISKEDELDHKFNEIIEELGNLYWRYLSSIIFSNTCFIKIKIRIRKLGNKYFFRLTELVS